MTASRRAASRSGDWELTAPNCAINPADEIVIGDIAHEQEQAVRHLVQAAVAQRVAGQGAGGDVPGLGARARSLCGIGSRRTASTRRASGTMGFATTLRLMLRPADTARGAPCTQKRPHPRCLESSAPRSTSQTGQAVSWSLTARTDACAPQVLANVSKIRCSTRQGSTWCATICTA